VTLDPNPRFVFALLVLMALPSIAGCRREAPDEVDIETAVAVKTAYFDALTM